MHSSKQQRVRLASNRFRSLMRASAVITATALTMAACGGGDDDTTEDTAAPNAPLVSGNASNGGRATATGADRRASSAPSAGAAMAGTGAAADVAVKADPGLW